MIEAQHLSKKFRKKTAVDDLSFGVELGKVTGFVGPNGSGKSTTMRLMLGLDKGDGSTLFDGQPLQNYPQPAKIVGILLEAKAFHPTRSAQNHLRILAKASQVDEKRVNEALEIVGLSDIGKKKPGKFSLGMSQRLGIAAAILGKPKYLLLDEPANGLDPEGIAWLRQFITNYAASGNAVFISSHLLNEMSQMADNVVVIGQGKLIRSSSVSELTTRSGHNRVFVRVANTEKFSKILRSKDIDFKLAKDGLEIAAKSTDAVGKLAHQADLAVLELYQQQASLEDAFLELTAEAQEYKTNAAGKI